MISLPDWGSDFNFVSTNYADATGAPYSIAKQDPSRWAIIFSNTGTKQVLVDINGNPTLTSGIFLAINSAPFLIYGSQVGGLVQAAWYAVGGTPLNSLQVVEVFYRPKR